MLRTTNGGCRSGGTLLPLPRARVSGSGKMLIRGPSCRWGGVRCGGVVCGGLDLLVLFFTAKLLATSTRGSPRSVSHFVSTLVGGVAARRGVNRLGLPIAKRVAAKRTGDDSVTNGVGGNRIKKLFGLGKIRGVHRMRGRTMRRSHLNVPLLFNVSIVRKCRAVFPVPLKLSYA